MWLDNYGLMSLLHPKIHQQPNRTLDARWLICLLCNWLRLSYSQIKSFVNMFIADHRRNKSQSKIPASYRWEIWIKSSPSMLFYILAMAIHVVIYRYTFIDQTTKSECLFLAHPVKLISDKSRCYITSITTTSQSCSLILNPLPTGFFFLMAMLQKHWILQFP